MRTALSIAGSDSSGGAGIQADLKTMTMNGVFAMTAITALTAQNTTGVSAISEVTPEFLGQQLDQVFTDIYPDAVKVGMVSSSELIKMIAAKLDEYDAKNVVVDPVMVSTSGARLIQEEAIETLVNELFPRATIITPNIPEAEILSDMKINNKDEIVTAAKAIAEKYNCSVLLKGGHDINDASDFLYIPKNENGEASEKWFIGKRIDNPNTHGTGCTLSSAIASNLAKGFGLSESVERAKDYISGALAAMLDLGKGSGPMNHAFDLKSKFAETNL
ncbi:MAG: bifunctional hydroxymethylpyrimidine kinase/phosphomethylpyrimidine kinase [Lachnospiraceae bacterium]|nr:bifunctional hydroxymethylpyrimidine kinase/phosphomethylpyrimidine kinase [Lachnospiraceae bacterium]